MFKRLWNLISRPAGYVGKDLQGNYFYEYPSTTSDPRRTRRVVKYRGKTDMHEVINRSRELSVQWKAWLTHTRVHPPTLEELQMDMARRERLAHNVAVIEARVQAEREERLRLIASQHEQIYTEQTALSEQISESQVPDKNQKTSSLTEKNDAGRHSTVQTKKNQEKQYDHDPWVPRPASDEPQAWSPRAASRG